MRPKLIALIAVSAVALVGCSAGEPTSLPTISSDPAAEALKNAPEGSVYDPESQQVMSMEEYVALDAPVSEIEKVDPATAAEDGFVSFAETRAMAHAIANPPKADAAIKALHDYCDSGKRIKLSKYQEYNENLEFIIDDELCESIDSK